jgi:glycosyltransferase involved in cell wall biosynthesis
MSTAPPIFFGGITVYLKEKLPLMRRAPAWLTWVLDRPALLKLATRRAASVDPAKLGDLTVSMLAGEKGNQSQELDALTRWLEEHVQPDVIHLSNAMLAGMARTFRQRLGCPVVSSLSGEDVFIERLVPPYYGQARDLLRERATDLDALVAMNGYYADYMASYLHYPRERVSVVPHGLNLAGHGARRRRGAEDEFVIGYMARVCHDKGLHLLAEAFALLNEERDLPPLRLHVAGYMAASDKRYLQEIERRLKRAGVLERYAYAGELDRAEKIAFLQSLDVMALPTVYRESKGLPALEAMANAVPIVVPAHGTFPELIADSGGGLLCDPEDPRSLASRLAELIRDTSLAEDLGRRGQEAVQDRYHADLMAERTRQLYERTLAERAEAVPRT